MKANVSEAVASSVRIIYGGQYYLMELLWPSTILRETVLVVFFPYLYGKIYLSIPEKEPTSVWKTKSCISLGFMSVSLGGILVEKEVVSFIIAQICIKCEHAYSL